MFLCVARAGIEPARRGFKVLRLTAWLPGIFQGTTNNEQ